MGRFLSRNSASVDETQELRCASLEKAAMPPHHTEAALFLSDINPGGNSHCRVGGPHHKPSTAHRVWTSLSGKFKPLYRHTHAQPPNTRINTVTQDTADGALSSPQPAVPTPNILYTPNEVLATRAQTAHPENIETYSRDGTDRAATLYPTHRATLCSRHLCPSQHQAIP